MLVGSVGQRGNQLRSNEFFKIHVKHIPTGETVSFEGFVTQFSDTYTAQWNEEQVYGRMDPLATYQGTKRGITLGFDIPNDSKVMATFNMRRIQKLIQFMYPVYDSGDLSTQNVLTAAPLLTLKWTNLISSVNNEGQELVGYINGPISYAPDVSQGGFMHGAIVQHAAKEGQIVNGKQLRIGSGGQEKKVAIRNYFPKKLSLNFNFTVLHTHLLGWAPSGKVDNWDGQPEAVVEHAKLHNMPSRNQTTTYSFGGSTDVASRFPNIYKAPPPPAPPVRQQGEEQLQQDRSDADLRLRIADADNDAGYDAAASAAAERAQAAHRDRVARLQELMHGGRDATSAETLPEDGRGLLDADLSSVLGDRGW